MIDPREYNRQQWNRQVEAGNMWTVPVDEATIARARRGEWAVLLTPTRPVPRSWFGDIAGKDVLGLASGGGQQCPVFAAAGARVTLLDASDRQLQRDDEVASREGLAIRTVQGFMDDLSPFADASFDLIFNPVSTVFAPDLLPVWRECARVLRPGGALLTGFCNPVNFLFDPIAVDRGEFVVKHALPYSDFDLSEEEWQAFIAANPDDGTKCFSHSLEAQIGGQLQAGLQLTAMFEDSWTLEPLSRLYPPYIATRSVKAA